VEALEHAHLRNIGEAEQPVGGGVVELRPIEEAAIQAGTISPPGSAFTAAPKAV